MNEKWRISSTVEVAMSFLMSYFQLLTDLLVLATWNPVVRLGRVVSLLTANEWMPSIPANHLKSSNCGYINII
jgi:hypothetical protein